MKQRRHDRGAAELELVLGVGFMLLPVALLVLQIPQWPQAQTAARSTAKETATLMVNAPSAEAGLEAAEAALERASANLDQDMTMVVEGEWCRGCDVTVTVTVEVPAIVVPGIGSTGAIEWSTSSTARVDDYRSLDAP
jgi:hypothetical protein